MIGPSLVYTSLHAVHVKESLDCLAVYFLFDVSVRPSPVELRRGGLMTFCMQAERERERSLLLCWCAVIYDYLRKRVAWDL